MIRGTLRLITVALLTTTLSSPGMAAHKDALHESFTARAFPFPNPSEVTKTDQPTCLAGVEGVHKYVYPFNAPAAGTLAVKMESFRGNWDLYVTKPDGKYILGGSHDPTFTIQNVGFEDVAVQLRDNQEILIVACNVLGEHTAEVEYAFHFKQDGEYVDPVSEG